MQRLAGVCLERFMVATRYGGPILRRWPGEESPLLPRQWVDVAIKVVKIFEGVHSRGVVHNDLKGNNLCLEVTPTGFEVTLIDFGLAKRTGKSLSLSGAWSADGCYPPEFFEEGGGRRDSRSEIYAIGLMRRILRRVRPETPRLAAWQEESQRHEADSRPRLDDLLDALREEHKILRRQMR